MDTIIVIYNSPIIYLIERQALSLLGNGITEVFKELTGCSIHIVEKLKSLRPKSDKRASGCHDRMSLSEQDICLSLLIRFFLVH